VEKVGKDKDLIFSRLRTKIRKNCGDVENPCSFQRRFSVAHRLFCYEDIRH